ncbi:MAG: hypothetical protein ABIH86_04490 [Planctomycetota bacterium]
MAKDSKLKPAAGDAGMDAFLSELKTIKDNRGDKALLKTAGRTMMFGKRRRNYWLPALVAVVIFGGIGLLVLKIFKIQTTPPPDSLKPSYGELMLSARQNLGRRRYDPARKFYDEAIQAAPNSEQRGIAYFDRGKSYIDQITSIIKLSDTVSDATIVELKEAALKDFKSAQLNELNTVESNATTMRLLITEPYPSAISERLSECQTRLTQNLHALETKEKLELRDLRDTGVCGETAKLLIISTSLPATITSAHKANAKLIAKRCFKIIADATKEKMTTLSDTDEKELERIKATAAAAGKQIADIAEP